MDKLDLILEDCKKWCKEIEEKYIIDDTFSLPEDEEITPEELFDIEREYYNLKDIASKVENIIKNKNGAKSNEEKELL